jgi:hypothetical protein
MKSILVGLSWVLLSVSALFAANGDLVPITPDNSGHLTRLQMLDAPRASDETTFDDLGMPYYVPLAYKSVYQQPNGAFILAAAGRRELRIWHIDQLEILGNAEDRYTTTFKTFPVRWQIAGLAFRPGVEQAELTYSLCDGYSGLLVMGSITIAQTPCVTSLAFTPDGAQIALGFLDGTIAIWNANTLLEDRRWQAHQSAVVNLAFSEGRNLISTGTMDINASQDASIRQWEWSTGELVQTKILWDQNEDNDYWQRYPMPGFLRLTMIDGQEVMTLERGSPVVPGRQIDELLLQTGLPRQFDHKHAWRGFSEMGDYAYNHAGTVLANTSLYDGFSLFDTFTMEQQAFYQDASKAPLIFSPDDRLLMQIEDAGLALWGVLE